MAATSLLIVLNHAPQGSAWVREGLDVALVTASLGQPVSLLLTGDGVYAAVRGQSVGALGQKGTLRMLEGLDMYDISPIYVDAPSLEARGLESGDLIECCSLCTTKALLHRHSHTLVF